MGAIYEVSGQIHLDTSREAAYLLILEQLREELLPEEYGYDPATGNFWIDCWATRSHAAMARLDDALTRLGRYALQGAKLDTRYEGGDVEPFWVGPDNLAIVRAQLAETKQEIAWALDRLARLLWEEELWRLQQSVGS